MCGQMEPSSLPKGMKPASDLPIEPVKFETVQCPHGTVPVRRTRKKDLIAAKTLSTSYGAPSNEGGYHVSKINVLFESMNHRLLILCELHKAQHFLLFSSQLLRPSETGLPTSTEPDRL